MAQVFKTKKDSPFSAEFPEGGVLGPRGEGSIPVDRLVEIGYADFQEKDERGVIKVDEDGKPIPLTGKALKEAVDAFAEAHDFEVANEKVDEPSPPPSDEDDNDAGKKGPGGKS